MKQIDVGGLSFKELREGNRYYVDKTMLLADILGTNDRGVYLYTRPRRFGKSTNLSMLDAFFNIDYKGNDWFEGLEISDHHEYDRYRNAFPVIRIDMGVCKKAPFEIFISMFRESILSAFNGHRYLLDTETLDSRTRNLFESLKEHVTIDILILSIRILSEELTRYHGVKPIILIDEYDRAVADSFGDPVCCPIMDFISSFMYATIKGNENRQMVYVTGVMQIAKEGIFSGLNNISSDNVLFTRSDERFGFTESEVRDVLSYYGRSDDFETVKEWYDGYRFGDAEVYNPYSIMQYLSNRSKPNTYWTNTAKDVVLNWILNRIGMGTFSQMMSLINGDSIKVELDADMTYEGLEHSLNSVYSLMVMAGYLTAIPKEYGVYEISIPNKEVSILVNKKMKDLKVIDDGKYNDFNTAVLNGDCETMVRVLQSVLRDASYLILNDEHDYQLVMLTIMHTLSRAYSIRTEYEAGNGRLDMILTPKREGMTPLIFELKKVDSERELDGAVEDTIAQIHERRYHLDMSGDVVLFGIAFWSKIPRGRSERIQVRDGMLIRPSVS